VAYDAPKRPLIYPLKFPLTIVQQTETDTGEPASVFVWPEDSDERVLVPFMLSLNEYNVLANAVEVGRDIAYGEDSIPVLWLWLRNMREKVSICSMIIDCIMNDEDTKEAFRNFILNDPAINEHVETIAQNKVLSLENRTKNILKPEECDPDYIFNQASVLVQLLHDLSEDVFEAIEVGTNQLERADIFVGAFPAGGLNDTAATVFRVADQLAEEIQEEYMGAYDEGMYDTLRCAVFCACKDDCNLSIVKVIAIYAELLNEEIPDDPIEALLAVMQFIATGDLPTDGAVYVMHMLILAGIQAGDEILGIDFSRMGNRVLAAGDEADNDWMTLCEDCDEPPPPDPFCLDLTEDHTDWEIAFGVGSWIDGEGFKGRVEDNVLFVHRTSWVAGNINRVVVRYNAPVTNITISYDNGASPRAYTGTPLNEIEFSIDTFPETWVDMPSVNGMFIQNNGASGFSSSTRFIELCVYYAE